MPVSAPPAQATLRPGRGAAIPAAAAAARARRRRPDAVVAGALLLGLVPFLDVLGDPDVWWHIRLGHWILDHRAVPREELFSSTVAGGSFTPHEWLSEVLFATLHSAGGMLLLAAVVCAAGWSGLVALALVARSRGAPAVAVAVAVVVGARAIEPVAGVRPQMLSFALLCWVLLLADRHLRGGGRTVWLIPVLLLLWANLHAGFIAGVGALALVTAVEAARLRVARGGGAGVDGVRVRVLATVTLVAAAAACLNPNGPGIYRYALLGSLTESHKPITEWRSPDFSDPADWGLLLLAVGWAGLVVLRRRVSARDVALGIAGIAGALVAVRNIAVCVAFTLPALALMLGDAWHAWAPSRLRERPLRLRVSSVVALGAAVAVVAGIGARRLVVDASAPAESDTYPRCAADLLASLPGPLTVYSAYADGGYLVGRDWPHVRVYIYGADDAMGMQVIDDYLRIASGTTAASSALRLLDRDRVDAVLATRDGPLDAVLRRSGAWRSAGSDHGRDIWLRDALPVPPSPCA